MDVTNQETGWDVTIGDAVVIVTAEKHSLNDRHQADIAGTPALFEATYLGPSRSYSVKNVRFEQGKARLINNEDLAYRLQSTPGFQVRLTTRAKVTIGRVLTIYRNQRPTMFWMPDEQPERYDFVVVAPNGAVCSADEIRPATKEELAELNKAEVDEVLGGRQPYRDKLQMVGKGKWGVPEPEPEPKKIPCPIRKESE